jgi:hypothetical protein
MDHQCYYLVDKRGINYCEKIFDSVVFVRLGVVGKFCSGFSHIHHEGAHIVTISIGGVSHSQMEVV